MCHLDTKLWENRVKVGKYWSYPLRVNKWCITGVKKIQLIWTTDPSPHQEKQPQSKTMCCPHTLLLSWCCDCNDGGHFLWIAACFLLCAWQQKGSEWLPPGALWGIINIPGRPQTGQLLLKWGWQRVFKFCTTFAQTNQLFTRVLINSSVLISRDLQQWKNNQWTCCMCTCNRNVCWSTVGTHIRRHTHTGKVDRQKSTQGLIMLKLIYKNTHCRGQRGHRDGNACKNKQSDEIIAQKKM